ncbi:hypothetical protein Niako_6808 [Niastella koreensis GR20-10]|uniref:Uncharacterized protein n=1 Tax=Niastella koreensis (strain DSM 17620 / KACC 11465 / NBRC 106392 / GR20-10) TaxID=700598 RepID=G8TLF8_NIAKG|nr:hypothetical protein Niako_6808 [Niastella koreensis GR20-10]
MRQKRLSLLSVLLLFIPKLLSAQKGSSPQTQTNVPYATYYNKTIITSYSYEVVPIMFYQRHLFADASFMFYPIMQSELAKTPELNQYPGL